MVSVAAGLSGTMALVRGEPDWRERLPMDAGAVFGSFWAVPLSVPGIVLFVECMRQAAMATPEAAEAIRTTSPTAFVVANLVSALLCWAASLVVLTQLAARSGAGWRVSPLIVGYNWSRLIVNLVAGIGAGAVAAFSAWPMIAVIALLALSLTVWLDFAVIRRALDLSAGRAFGAFAIVVLARGVASLSVDVVSRIFVG